MKWVLFALSALVVPSAFGESHVLGTASLLAPLTPGIAGPSVRLEGKEHSYVVMFQYKKANGNFQTCSGTVVEGCVVTAGHCFDDYRAGETINVVNSDDDKKSHVLENFGRDPKVMGGSGFSDLAVFRLDVPARNFLSRSSLARSEAVEFPLSAEIVGFGATGSTEAPDGTVTNTGIGEKRAGNMRLLGLGDVDMRTILFDPRVGATRGSRYAVASRGPSITAVGDSGGPLFVKGKLYGVTSGGVHLALNPGREPRAPRPEENVFSRFAVVADHVTEIERKMDELDCASNTHQRVLDATLHRLKTLGESPNGRAAGNAWLDAARADDRTAIVADLARLVGLGKQNTVRVKSTSRNGNTLVVELEAKKPDGTVAAHLQVEADIATGRLQSGPAPKK